MRKAVERCNDAAIGPQNWESILGEISDQQQLKTNTGLLGLAPRQFREKHQMAGASR